MNYKGQVTAVNPINMSFELDNNIVIHTGHYAASTNSIQLPEIGEHVKIFNAHFMVTSTNNLEKLFVCDRGKILCDHYTVTDETTFIELIDEYNLGCSDLQAIDSNVPVVSNYIKGLTQSCAWDIMFEIVRVLGDINKSKNKHKCLNKIVAPLTLQTISNYRFVDLYPNKEKIPAWFFGSHSKDRKDKLLGFLQINKRYGILLLRDVNGMKPCVVVNSVQVNMLNVINKFVIIQDFRNFTELYREDQVPSSEYVFFDLKDVLVLENIHRIENVQQLIVDEVPEDFSYVYRFKFSILKKASVSINKHSQIECWLEVLLLDEGQQIYLGFNAYQVQITPLLQEGHVYEVYHSEKLVGCVNKELTRMKTQKILKFQEKTAIFVYISDSSLDEVLKVGEVCRKTPSGSLLSVQGIISVKKLTPALTSRTKSNCSLKEFGTPGTSTHTLILDDFEGDSSLVLYLNNWENLQMPLGLIPGMRVCVKNVLYHKNYLKSTVLTSFQILSYNPPVFFDTVNLYEHLERGCDKYSYLGWGDLIPCNVLVWSRVSTLFIRSVKITFNCVGCTSECCCLIDTTLTFYVNDEFGAALVLSKSLVLLQLLLGLEPEQWEIWCNAFKEVKEYVYSCAETIHLDNLLLKSFCDALTMSIQVTNASSMSNLEIKCRKIDGDSNEDNNGVPLWFCVDARKKDWSFSD